MIDKILYHRSSGNRHTYWIAGKGEKASGTTVKAMQSLQEYIPTEWTHYTVRVDQTKNTHHLVILPSALWLINHENFYFWRSPLSSVRRLRYGEWGFNM